MRLALAALAISSLAASGATAMTMSSIDTNGNGMLSYKEVHAAMPKVTKSAFGKADTNSDGQLSKAELAAAEKSGILPKMG